jgi:hypothetical protein
VCESLFDCLGSSLAGHLAGALAADPVEHREQATLGERKKAILINGSFGA